jgi:hypothetical protein
LNTSKRVGAAFVIFQDRGKKARDVELADLSPAILRSWAQTTGQAIELDPTGNVTKVDELVVSRLPPNVAAHINAFFKLRAKRDLFSPS